MKSFYPLLFCLVISLSSYSQTQFSTGSEGYYTIVGAFAIKENAAKYNASLQKKGMGTSYGFLASQNIYYVYTTRDPDVSVCLKEMRVLREKPEFWDAWVRYIREDGTKENGHDARIEEQLQPEAQPVASIAQAAPVQDNAPEEEPEEVEEEIIQHDKITLENTEIFLSLYSARTDKVADGVVQVVDAERGRLIEEVKGNTYLILPDPKNKNGNMSLIADVLGYRKVQKEINFNDPLADSSFIVLMGTTLVANFPMIRYQKGDIRTLYNIYFYNDAAVMMPESRFELNQLLDMMKENESYRIKLHGHTNGNYHGKIIKVGESGDFFSVAKDAKTTVGSAKALSESRASVIRDWLIANGVDGSRVEVKAWGGKRPLFDKHSANAKKNIRVEVEIIDD